MKKIRKYSMAENFGFQRPPPTCWLDTTGAISDLRRYCANLRRDLNVALEALNSVGLVERRDPRDPKE